jgi:hypothetical protein
VANKRKPNSGHACEGDGVTSKPKGYMFDTNIFDRVMDDEIDLSRLLVDIQLYVTHIQRD